MRTIVIGLLIVLLVVACAWGLVGCKGSTHLLSTDQEIEIGNEAAADFDRQHPVDRTSPLARRLAGIGANVGAAASPPDYPYSFTLVQEDVVNAFALPGGPIYFYKGLVDALGDDTNKIAWVMGHEITHIRQQHAVRRIERAVGASVLIGLLLGDGDWGQVAGTVGGLALMDYGRDHEFMADALGLQWAHNAGYDATAAVGVLEKFQELQGQEPSDFEIFFMTHPGNNDRINNVKALCDQYGYSGAYYP